MEADRADSDPPKRGSVMGDERHYETRLVSPDIQLELLNLERQESLGRLLPGAYHRMRRKVLDRNRSHAP